MDGKYSGCCWVFCKHPNMIWIMLCYLNYPEFDTQAQQGGYRVNRPS